ncbi:MAG: acetoacetate--CoA ligase [Myxococcota bacterium]
MADTPCWTPDPAVAATTRMARLAERVRQRGVPITGYDDLWRWSVTEREAFWALLWDELAVLHSAEPTEVATPLLDSVRQVRWFTGARLNFAENLLQPDAPHDDTPRLVARDDAGRRVALTHAALCEQVGRLAAFLVAQCVGPGDRVAAFLPNREEAVIGMLAATRIGAVWSSCSPDFGRKGVLDRFGQIEPAVLFACDGYRYGGKEFDTRERVAEIAGALPSLKALVWVPVTGLATEGGVRWVDALACADPAPPFAQLPFDHPVYVMYSSGTTGVPKCIVHGAGGTLLQHGKEHVLHSDVRPGDRIAWYTTTGWMMWNWLVSGLAARATVVLVDGSPAHGPGGSEAGALWRIATEERLTHLGTSPKYLGACEKVGLEPRTEHDLGALRAVMSTGSPLPPDGFRWVARAVGDVQLASICGGTDILGCFMLGSPIDPVWPGEIQKRGLGMAVEAWDEHGRPVVGAKGELVCTAPFPSMPVGFWNDAGEAKYRAAYFAYPEGWPVDTRGVWRHGDWIEVTARGGVIVYGRADATLNPGGVRIGTAEIYEVVEAMPEVVDSLVVSQDWQDDTRVVLFVVPAAGVALDVALVDRIKREIRTQCTPRHVPAKILAVAEVPRTISGKKVELAVQRILRGEAVPNRDALANPAALDLYAGRPELAE